MHHRDPRQAFTDAIGEGILSDRPTDPNYAGLYMYMGSEGIQDLFKHRETRRYIRTDYTFSA